MSLEVFPRPGEECIKRIRDELNLDEQSLKHGLEAIKVWLRQQPHLPNDEDERILENWLIRCKNSIESTKKTLDAYFSLRTRHPDVMCGWDATEPWFDDSSEYGYVVALPDLTPELDRVVFFGYFDKELGDTYDVWNSVKIMLMFTEIRLFEDYNAKEVYIMDMGNMTFEHVKHLTFTVIKKLETCFLSGYKARVRAIHFVNTPKYTEVLIAALKSVLKSKLVSRVYVHGSDLSELHKQVPIKILPAELGGESGNVQELWDLWKLKLKNYKSHFKKRDDMKSDESKRIHRKDVDTLSFGQEGSFRKLGID